MQVTVGQDAKTVYGWGEVVKVNAKSVIVNVNGQNHKLSAVQYGILNPTENYDVNDVCHSMHY